MKKLFRGLTALLSGALAVLFVFYAAAMQLTPSSMKTDSLSTALPDGDLPLSLSYPSRAASAQAEPSGHSQYNAKLMLLGTFPVKDVSVSLEDRKYVIPGGTPFGIRIYTEGLVVSGTVPVSAGNAEVCPAEQAGIEKGDIILSVNGKALTSNEQLLSAVEKSCGEPVLLDIKRNSRLFSASVTPVFDVARQKYRTGLYVRDSCAGIGTMTFTDPETGSFAGLGHGICDSESERLMPMLHGDIVPAEITSVRKSCCGEPGSLVGHFSSGKSIGTVIRNSENGIYGKLLSVPESSGKLPVAFRQEVVKGKASLLTSVDGSDPEYYDIEIEDISYNDSSTTKNMVIKVTDERLLTKTGGIVQGMSGSPIIQNGRLAGAVTHVFVNDTVRGYAVFAENMLEISKNLEQTIHDQAA